jgi:type VI secretion system secreted protein Hcp
MAVDIFAKIGTIKGESPDVTHKDEIEVLSYSWGVQQTLGPVDEGSGKANFQDFTIVHRIDKSTPALMLACATGSHFKDGIITQRKAGKEPQEYLIIKMNDIIITGITQGGDTTAPGSETVSMSFAKVDFEYRSQKPDGTLDAGVHFKYDIKANKEG